MNTITEYLIVITIFIGIANGNYAVYDDYKNHPCKRDCNRRYHPMECVYDFTAEWYTAMNEECGNCPFNITDCYRKNCVALNGKTRAIMTINHMIPGPSIEVCEGDTIVVNYHNMLRILDGSTIHWHGLLHKQSQNMDGVPMITQCPIMMGDSFQYRFPAENYGTYWWHSHSTQQRTDGIFGPLVIRQNKSSDPYFDHYDYDLSEHVILLNDWFNETFLVTQGPHVKSVAMVDADALLINGRGVLVDFTDSASNKSLNTPRSVFNVEHGKRYRFRLISSGITSCPMKFSIEGHELKVIATDGTPIEAVNVKYIVLHSGERYDFIVNANQEPKDYVVKVTGDSMCEKEQTAILSYVKPIKNARYRRHKMPISKGSISIFKEFDNWDDRIDGKKNEDILHFMDKFFSKSKKPTPTPTPTSTKEAEKENRATVLNPIDTSEEKESFITVANLRAKSIKNKNDIIGDIKKKATKKIFLNIEAIAKFNKDYPLEPFTYQWQNISNKMPPIPLLFDYDLVPKNLFCNAFDRSACGDDESNICSCTHLYQLDLNDVVEIIAVDLDQYKVFPDNSVHMIHVHGYKFAVLSSELFPGTTRLEDVYEMDKNGSLVRNFDSPPIKDTTVVPPGGYTIVRFVADNPGVWIFHCHTEFHMETGLSLFFRVGETEDLPIEKPEAWPECGTFKYNLRNNSPKKKEVSKTRPY